MPKTPRELAKFPAASRLHVSKKNPDPHFDLYNEDGTQKVVPVIVELTEGPVIFGVSTRTGKIYPVKLSNDP